MTISMLAKFDLISRRQPRMYDTHSKFTEIVTNILKLGYCGNTLTNNGASGAVIASTQCQTACGGDASTTCGGSWTLNVYTQVPSTSPTAWTSAGCYVDASTRMLRVSATLSQAGLTTELCISTCTQGGFTMAGTENGNQCFCGSQIYQVSGAGVSTASSECSSACNGK
jgi:glucan endo-1,3-alpha-glucosidase